MTADITDQEIIERLEAWFPGAKNYWDPHHARFTKITRFTKIHGDGAQWVEKNYDERKANGRLSLTENLLGPFVAQVVNDLKQSNFAIQVKGRDDGTDPKLAKVRQGIHRGIQINGKWSNCIGQAADDLVTGGYCATRIITQYANPKTFRKDIKYIGLSDPTRMFHGDGSHSEDDYSDVTDSLVYEPYSNSKFKREFGQDPKDFLETSECSPVWGSKTTGPWVSEYFFKQEIPDTLVMFGDKEMYLSELKAKHNDSAKETGLKVEDLIANDKNGEPITRESYRCQVWWVKLAGKKVLKKEKWPGYWIPNFVGHGRKVTVSGETFLYGLAEPAVDSQRLHNFAVSSHAERLAYAPKIPIYAAIESIPAKFMDAWNNINTSSNSVAYYNAFDAAGNALPPPRRENSIQSDPGFLDLKATTEQGIKGTMGMWESALGQKSNETTGVAIGKRERQATTGNYNWGANLAIMAEHMGRVTDELLDKVIDVPTQVRMVGEDDKEEVIWAASLEEGEDPGEMHDLNRGEFDIICKMTPSSDTKRDEATQGLQALFQSAPELAEILSDFFVQEQDWRLSDKATERIRKFLAMKYPGVVEPEDGKGQPQIPPQVQQELTRLQQENQQLNQHLQEIGPENQQLKIENQSIKASKDVDHGKLQLDAQKIEIERFKADTERMSVIGAQEAANGNLLLKADAQSHKAGVDGATLELAHRKVHIDQKSKQAALDAKPTEARSGNSATDSDKSGSTMEG